MTISAEDDRGESDSVGVDVTGGVEHLVVAEVTAKYEHTWDHEYKFTQTEHAERPAAHARVVHPHGAHAQGHRGLHGHAREHHLEPDRGVLRPPRHPAWAHARAVLPPFGAGEELGQGAPRQVAPAVLNSSPAPQKPATCSLQVAGFTLSTWLAAAASPESRSDATRVPISVPV